MVKSPYTCIRCGHIFSQKQNLINHFKNKNGCKYKPEIKGTLDIELTEEVKDNNISNRIFLSSAPTEFQEESGSVEIDVDNILSFENEDKSYITQEVVNCHILKSSHFVRLIYEIWFNKQHPENHVVYKDKLRYCSIFTKEKKWIEVPNREICKIIAHGVFDIASQHCDPFTYRRLFEKLVFAYVLNKEDDLKECNLCILTALRTKANLVKKTHKMI